MFYYEELPDFVAPDVEQTLRRAQMYRDAAEGSFDVHTMSVDGEIVSEFTTPHGEPAKPYAVSDAFSQLLEEGIDEPVDYDGPMETEYLIDLYKVLIGMLAN